MQETGSARGEVGAGDRQCKGGEACWMRRSVWNNYGRYPGDSAAMEEKEKVPKTPMAGANKTSSWCSTHNHLTTCLNLNPTHLNLEFLALIRSSPRFSKALSLPLFPATPNPGAARLIWMWAVWSGFDISVTLCPFPSARVRPCACMSLWIVRGGAYAFNTGICTLTRRRARRPRSRR